MIVLAGQLFAGYITCLWQIAQQEFAQTSALAPYAWEFLSHAKRNEFHFQCKMLLRFSGSLNFEEPNNYSETVRKLLPNLGVDFDRLAEATAPGYPLNSLSQPIGMFLEGQADKQIITGKWLTELHGLGDFQDLVNQLPLPEAEQKKLFDFICGERDYLPLREKCRYNNSTSYAQLLVERVGLAQQTASAGFPNTLHLWHR